MPLWVVPADAELSSAPVSFVACCGATRCTCWPWMLICPAGPGALGCLERRGAASRPGRSGGHPAHQASLTGPCGCPRWGARLEQNSAFGLGCLSMDACSRCWPGIGLARSVAEPRTLRDHGGGFSVSKSDDQLSALAWHFGGENLLPVRVAGWASTMLAEGGRRVVRLAAGSGAGLKRVRSGQHLVDPGGAVVLPCSCEQLAAWRQHLRRRTPLQYSGSGSAGGSSTAGGPGVLICQETSSLWNFALELDGTAAPFPSRHLRLGRPGHRLGLSGVPWPGRLPQTGAGVAVGLQFLPPPSEPRPSLAEGLPDRVDCKLGSCGRQARFCGALDLVVSNPT